MVDGRPMRAIERLTRAAAAGDVAELHQRALEAAWTLAPTRVAKYDLQGVTLARQGAIGFDPLPLFIDLDPEERDDPASALAVRLRTRERAVLAVALSDGVRACSVLAVIWATPARPHVDARSICAMIADIVALATRTRRLEVAAREQEALAALGMCVAGAAHEINNATTIARLNIQLACSLLEDAGEEGAPAAARLQRAAHAVHQIAALARSLRGAPDEARQRPERLDPNALAHAALAMATDRLPQDTEVEAALEARQQIHADPSVMLQVMLHLLIHAGDALALHKAPRLRVRTFDLDDHVAIEVAGHGGPDDPPAGSFGAGLGLRISRDLVAEHGGRLGFTADPERGTTFRIELPASPASASSRAGPLR